MRARPDSRNGYVVPAWMNLALVIAASGLVAVFLGVTVWAGRLGRLGVRTRLGYPAIP